MLLIDVVELELPLETVQPEFADEETDCDCVDAVEAEGSARLIEAVRGELPVCPELVAFVPVSGGSALMRSLD